MTFDVIDVPQRSEAWHQARCGRLTGSRAGAMLSAIKAGEAAARRDMRLQLVTERLVGKVQDDGFVSKDMQRGTDLEEAALTAYEAHTGHLLTQVGFLSARDLMAGYSPDALVDGGVGFVEVKVPRSANHLRYLKARALPSEHSPQIHHGFWISGAEWCEFVSYDDRFPPGMQLVVVRINRADLDIAGYEKKAIAFLEETDAEYNAVCTLGNLAGQLEASLHAV